MKSFYSELPFASLLVYSPRGTSGTSKKSQRVRDKVKSGNAQNLRLAMKRLGERFGDVPFSQFLGDDVSLVPVPGSSPRKVGSLSIPHQLSDALVAASFGRGVYPCLVRTEAVPKSAYAEAGKRTDVARHIATMKIEQVEPVLMPPKRITLVDDFVTKGRTLFAAASVLTKAFPAAEIRAFALVRTMGLVTDIEEILAPCAGRITRAMIDGDVSRVP